MSSGSTSRMARRDFVRGVALAGLAPVTKADV